MKARAGKLKLWQPFRANLRGFRTRSQLPAPASPDHLEISTIPAIEKPLAACYSPTYPSALAEIDGYHGSGTSSELSGRRCVRETNQHRFDAVHVVARPQKAQVRCQLVRARAEALEFVEIAVKLGDAVQSSRLTEPA